MNNIHIGECAAGAKSHTNIRRSLTMGGRRGPRYVKKFSCNKYIIPVKVERGAGRPTSRSRSAPPRKTRR